MLRWLDQLAIVVLFSFLFVLHRCADASSGHEAKFWLFTHESRDLPKQLSSTDVDVSRSSGFRVHHPTKVIIHGYALLEIFSSISSILDVKDWFGHDMKNKILKKDNVNLIVVDWLIGAKTLYNQAAKNTGTVGDQLTKLLEFLVTKIGADPKSFHLIGFSLGAHLAGHVGKTMKENGLSIGRITGLDPAGKSFEGSEAAKRLDPTDADFVDVIHTTRLLGYDNPLGHVDFYVNGGHDQPGSGCNILTKVTGVCGHVRAAEYFMETIESSCPWRGYKCPDEKTFREGRCLSCHEGCPSLGYNAHKGVSGGKYFLLTNLSPPFCAFHYLVIIYTKHSTWTNWGAGLIGWPHIDVTGDQGKSGEVNLGWNNIHGGDVDRFVILSRKDLGELKSITVWHNTIFDDWTVHKVEVKPGWSSNVYTACFNLDVKYSKKQERPLYRQPLKC